MNSWFARSTYATLPFEPSNDADAAPAGSRTSSVASRRRQRAVGMAPCSGTWSPAASGVLLSGPWPTAPWGRGWRGRAAEISDERAHFVLREDPRRPGLEERAIRVRIAQRRPAHHLRATAHGADRRGRLRAVHVGHRPVDDRDVRGRALRRVDA